MFGCRRCSEAISAFCRALCTKNPRAVTALAMCCGDIEASRRRVGLEAATTSVVRGGRRGLTGEGLKDEPHVGCGPVLLDVELFLIASEEWPRTRAAVSEPTRGSIKVATVLRKVCRVTQPKPVSVRIVRQRRSILPTCVAKAGA